MMMKSCLSFILLVAVGLHQVSGFTSLLNYHRSTTSSPPPLVSSSSQPQQLSTALFMGRAAAVRAATKSKTDLKKAKTNAVFGKKIIMAVKQGGSPDPVANRQLGDVIKQAKANSVPVDVSFTF